MAMLHPFSKVGAMLDERDVRVLKGWQPDSYRAGPVKFQEKIFDRHIWRSCAPLGATGARSPKRGMHDLQIFLSDFL